MRIGVVSDTHGTLDDRVLELLAGVDLVLHAGDVGAEDVLDRLAALAPVVAVAGNCDVGPLGGRLRWTETVDTPAGPLMLTHVPPGKGVPESVRVVVFGHTHFPVVLADGDVTLLNPGSASRGRGAPPTVAILTLEPGELPRAQFWNVESGDTYPPSQSARHGHDKK